MCKGYIRRFCGQVRKIVVNLIKVWEFNKSILIAQSLLLQFPDDIIPTSSAIFVYNGSFVIARSVRNVLGCNLSRDVKLACNKPYDIACLHSLDFTQILLLTIHQLYKKRKYSILCKNVFLYLKQEIMKRNMREQSIKCLPYAEAKKVPERNTRTSIYITFVTQIRQD